MQKEFPVKSDYIFVIANPIANTLTFVHGLSFIWVLILLLLCFHENIGSGFEK